MQSYARDLSQLVKTDGLNSGIYAALTVGFIIAGLGYEFAPVQSMDAIFGTLAGKGVQIVLLWQLIGGAVATAVAPLAYTTWVSACKISLRQLTYVSARHQPCVACLGVAACLLPAPLGAGVRPVECLLTKSAYCRRLPHRTTSACPTSAPS